MATLPATDDRRDIPELGQFALKLYKDWADNRRDLEVKWQANRDAFRGLDEVSWQDPDADGRSNDGAEGTSTTFRGKNDWHSKHTLRLTKQKVMTAFALVIDAVLQGGRVPFLLKLAGDLQVNSETLPPEALEHIEGELNDMTQRIHQQLDRCDASRQLARSVLSAAIYGRCWAKFRPQSFKTRRMVAAPPQVAVDPATGQLVQGPDQWAIESSAEVGPTVAFISVWDVFDDREAEDPRNGAGVIHRQYVSARQFHSMATQGPGWDSSAVARALREASHRAPSQGDSSDAMTPRLRDVTNRKNVVRVLECWVQVPREYVERYEADSSEMGLSGGQIQESETTGDDIPCLVVMAGDEIVRFMRLESGEPWPFYSVPWEEDIDEPSTYGVADNLTQTQAVLNSAIRAFEDNKRFSSSILLGIKRRMINNPGWDGKVKPGTVLEVAEEARSIADAISAFVVPDVGANLLQLIEMFVAFGDEESMLPKIQSGGRDSQQTAYEASIRVEKAGKYMGAVVRNFDDYWIAPVIRDFYEWNMLDPQVQTGKGAYDVRALGFTSFQDRVMRLQAIQQFLAMTLVDPELRKMVKLDDALREITKALDLDPDQWLRSLKELQDASQQQQPNPAEVLAIEGQKAQIGLTAANTDKAKVETMAIAERLKIERAMAVKDLKAPVESPAKPAVTTPVSPSV